MLILAAQEPIGPYTIGLAVLMLIGLPLATRYVKTITLGPVRAELARNSAKLESIDKAVNGIGPMETPIKDNAAEAAKMATEATRRLLAFETQMHALTEHTAETRRIAREAINLSKETRDLTKNLEGKMDVLLDRIV